MYSPPLATAESCRSAGPVPGIECSVPPAGRAPTQVGALPHVTDLQQRQAIGRLLIVEAGSVVLRTRGQARVLSPTATVRATPVPITPGHSPDSGMAGGARSHGGWVVEGCGQGAAVHRRGTRPGGAWPCQAEVTAARPVSRWVRAVWRRPAPTADGGGQGATSTAITTIATRG